MPAFSEVPLNSTNDLNNWLKFYNMSAPLIVVGTLASADPVSDILFYISLRVIVIKCIRKNNTILIDKTFSDC